MPIPGLSPSMQEAWMKSMTTRRREGKQMKSELVMVVGARPNMMKASAIARVMELYGKNYHIIYTGQHKSQSMGIDILTGLVEIKTGILYGLDIKKTSISKMMKAIKKKIIRIAKAHSFEPTVMVFGDVDSSLAAALAAKKIEPYHTLVHVEAALRSFDRVMPEEINRTMIDCISDFLLISEESARKNVESYAEESGQCVEFVGNTMLDTLNYVLRNNDIYGRSVEVAESMGLKKDRKYVVVTLHRPENVDNKENLTLTLERIAEFVPDKYKIIFPVHPRTERILEKCSSYAQKRFQCVPPLSYLDFIAMLAESTAVVTDSGGIQEESAYLGVPCITMRWSTERFTPIKSGFNILLTPEDTFSEGDFEDRVELAKLIKRRGPINEDGKIAQREMDFSIDSGASLKIFTYLSDRGLI